MPKLYELRYERSDGHYRTITMEADSKKHAEEIADARLAKQFPEDDSDNAQSNYELKNVQTRGAD